MSAPASQVRPVKYHPLIGERTKVNRASIRTNADNMKVFIKVQITHLCYDRYIDFVYRIMVLIFVWQNLLSFARQLQKVGAECMVSCITKYKGKY